MGGMRIGPKRKSGVEGESPAWRALVTRARALLLLLLLEGGVRLRVPTNASALPPPLLVGRRWTTEAAGWYIWDDETDRRCNACRLADTRRIRRFQH